MFNIRLTKLLVPAVLVGLLAACETVLIHEEPEQRHAPIKMNEVVFVDHSLNRIIKNKWTKAKTNIVKVTVESQGMRSTSTGTGEVWAVLRNRTDHPQQLEARTMFFDGGQAPTDVDPTWKRVFIPANSTATYKELSTSFDVAFYRIEIKGAE